MRRKDLIATTMALTLTVLVAGTLTACNSTESSSSEVVATEVQTEAQEEGYADVEVQKEYDAMLTQDKSLTDAPDSDTSVADLTKDTYVTVFATVQFNGIDVDYYHVRADDSTEGYIEGKYLDFNVNTLEDYADSLTEVEGGDGEETAPTETPAESTETPTETASAEVVVEEEAPFESYTRYTNTSANIRAGASKDTELVGTATINTEVTVIGMEGDWSKVEYNGLQAFIKSSLLSETKTEVKKPSSSNGGTSSGSSSTSSSGSTSTPQQPSQPSDSNLNLPPALGNSSVPTEGGTTGNNPAGLGGGK